MNAIIYRIPNPARGVLLSLGALFLLAACGDPAVEAPSGEAISAPPSIAGKAAAPGPQFIQLTDAQAAELAIETVPVRRERMTVPLSAPGTVHPSPDHIAVVSAPINGLVIAIHAHEGERVRRGDLLMELESLEFANLVADYLQARAEVQYQERQLERVRKLFDRKISPEREVERISAETSRAHAALQAANARLLAVGVTEGQIREWETSPDAHPHLRILADIDGVISEHLVDRGQAVTAYQKVASIVDTRRVLVRGFFSPEDAGDLHPGDTVMVSMRETPDEGIMTTVATIIPTLDAINKSVGVNMFVDTRQGWPLPGQHVRLTAMVRPAGPVMVIPMAAVQFEDDRASVFVAAGPQRFEKRPVTLGRQGGDRVIVSGGIQPGEEVAVTQVFTLKALARFSEFAE